MDAGDRTMHGAIVENRSVRVVHEDLSTELTRQSRKKCILLDRILVLNKTNIEASYLLHLTFIKPS